MAKLKLEKEFYLEVMFALKAIGKKTKLLKGYKLISLEFTLELFKIIWKMGKGSFSVIMVTLTLGNGQKDYRMGKAYG